MTAGWTIRFQIVHVSAAVVFAGAVVFMSVVLWPLFDDEGEWRAEKVDRLKASNLGSLSMLAAILLCMVLMHFGY